MDIRFVPAPVTSANLRYDPEDELYTLHIVSAEGDAFLESLEALDVLKLRDALSSVPRSDSAGRELKPTDRIKAQG